MGRRRRESAHKRTSGSNREGTRVELYDITLTEYKTQYSYIEAEIKHLDYTAENIKDT